MQFQQNGDLNNTNPKLGPLKKNGGPTQTMALKTISPAIDAGNPGGCTDNSGQLLTTDQRGQPRPGKGETSGCDMVRTKAKPLSDSVMKYLHCGQGR